MAAKVTFNATDRLITVTAAPVAGVVTLDVQVDLYSAMKQDFQQLSNSLAKNPPPFLNSVGGIPTASGYTGAYYFLNNAEGWRIEPYDADHRLYLIGNLFPIDSTVDWWISRKTRTISISREFSNLASLVGGGIGDQIETNLTGVQALQAIFAATAGKSSGLPGGPIKFRNRADNKDRISATFDANSNRLTVTYDFD
jgi:hypothetical protein